MTTPTWPSRLSPEPASPAPPVVRLRSPGEIVSAVPFLLGFLPETSVVVIALKGRRMVLTCRADLADVLDEEGLEGIVGAIGRSGAGDALIVGYSDGRDRASLGARRMSVALRQAGLGVAEVLTVTGGRWFNEACHDERCCPAEGVPVADHDNAPSTMAFHALSDGYRSGRDDLVRECHPDRPLLVRAVLSELRGWESDEDATEATMVEDLLAVLQWSGPGEPTAAQLARSAVACCDPAVRDLWYAVLAPGMMSGRTPELEWAYASVLQAGAAAGDLDPDGGPVDSAARDRLLRRVLAFIRALPDEEPEVTMAALVVAATTHWCAGDGARARVVIDRARTLPVPPLAMLETVAQCLAHGIGPGVLAALSDTKLSDSASPGSAHPGPDVRPGAGPQGRFIA